MTAPRARAKARTIVDTRRALIELEHPITGEDRAAQGEPLRWQVETVLINLIRDGAEGSWVLGNVVARGQYLIPAGPSGMSFDREYRSDVDSSARYHHADMPTRLAQLVHEEIAEPDEGEHTDAAAAVAEVARLARETFPDRDGNIHRALVTVLEERTMAWAALPESVRGDAAPAGTTLADRITAVVSERDASRVGHAHCHARHIGLEPAVDELLDAIEGHDPAVPDEVRRAVEALAMAKSTARQAARMAASGRGGDPRALVIRWDYDEQVTVLADGEQIYVTNHDEHGWDGMRAVIDTARALAETLGLPIVDEGVPNL